MTAPTFRRCFRIEEVDGKVAICEAFRLERRASWRFYRSIDGSEEWKERGDHWYDSAEQAFRVFITDLFPSRERRVINALFGGPTEEEDFRLMVQACALLWRYWRLVRESQAERESSHDRT